MPQLSSFQKIVENAASALGFSAKAEVAPAPAPASGLPAGLMAQLDAAVEAVAAVRDQMEREISDAASTKLQGVKAVSPRAAVVSSNALQMGSWSPTMYLPALQVEDLLDKMRSGRKGDVQFIRDLVDWQRDPSSAKVPSNMHPEVIARVAPTLSSWLDLQDAMARLQSPGVGAPTPSQKAKKGGFSR